MDEKSEQGITPSEDQLLDLSELAGITLGPAWSDVDNTSTVDKYTNKTAGKSSRSVSSTSSRRDRRPRLAQRVEKRAESAPPFKPIADVIFYPDDTAFKTLVKAIRASNKTYELFDITRLILAKPDRFVAMIRPVAVKDESPGRFYIALADGCPFESEQKAFEHCIDNFTDQYFKIETKTIDPPKGNFVMVNRCSITGELLGPPNYHRYQEFIEQHHASRLANISFGSFVSKIEAIKDPEVIEEWLQKMTTQTSYILKDAENSNDQPTFDNLKSAGKYLYENKIGSIVRAVSSVRLSGKLLSSMPANSAVRRSIEFHLESQRRFPLESANHLRGRLRRLKINVYKKGSHGISYICAVKRRFQLEGQNFADSVQALIDFIVKTSRPKVADIEESFLGIKKMESGTESPSSNESKGEESKELPPEIKEKLHLMRQDLFWLIAEGYVVEYEDGSLYASPPRSKAKDSPLSMADNATEAKTKESKGNLSSDEDAASDSVSIVEVNIIPDTASEEAVNSESLVKEEIKDSMSESVIESIDEEKVSVVSGGVEIAVSEDDENNEKST